MATKKIGVVSPFLSNRVNPQPSSRNDALTAAAARNLVSKYGSAPSSSARKYTGSINDPYSYGYGGEKSFFNTSPTENFDAPVVNYSPKTISNVAKIGVDDITQYTSGALKSIKPQEAEVAPNRQLNANAFPSYSIRFQVGGKATINALERLLAKLPKGSETAKSIVQAQFDRLAEEQAARYAAHTLSNQTGKDAIAEAKRILAPTEKKSAPKTKKQKFLEEEKHPSIPDVLYHGTKREFSAFEPKYDDGLSFFSTNPEFAGKWPQGSGGLRANSPENEAHYNELKAIEEKLREKYGKEIPSHDDPSWTEKYDAAREKIKQEMREKTGFGSAVEYENKAGIQVMPVHLAIKKPFDPRTDYKEVEDLLNSMSGMSGVVDNGLHKTGNWVVYERPEVVNHLKSKGYDGMWLSENVDGPHETIVPFDSKQIKSAIGNRGTYDLNDKDITKAHGGLVHFARGGVLHLAEGSQQFPVGKNYNTPVDGDIVPLKPIRPLADLVAKGTKGILDFATKPFGYENPPVEMLSNFLQLPSIPKTIENYAYGLPTTTGSGQTLKMSPDLEATVTNLAPMIGPSAKAVAKVTKKIAQEAAPIVSKKAVQALEKYGVNPNMYAAPEAPSFKDAVPQGMKMSQEGGKFVLYDASGNVFSKGDDAQSVIFRANKRLENEAANAARAAKAEAQVKVKDKKVPADNLGFYSPTQKAATNLKRNAGTGEVILSDIKKYPEVHSDEIQMSGLEDFLKGKENVTKEEVQAFMDENRPKITETEYVQGNGNFDDLSFDNGEIIHDDEYIGGLADDYIYDWDNMGHKSREEIADDILSAYEPEHQQQLMESGEITDLVNRQIEKYADQMATDIYYDSPYLRYQNDAGYEIVGNDDVGYSIRDPDGRPLNHRDAFDIETAEGYARDHAIEYGDYSGGDTKFHDYKLSGGDNYRELLIQTPNETNAAKVQALTDQYWEIDRQILEKNDQLYQKGINAHKLPSEQVPEHLNEVDALEKEVYELKKKQKEILDQREGVKGNDYQGSHWDEPNVVAHVRMDDRYDVEGKKVLYVDEAQSDWHQEGGEHGYKGKDAHVQEKKYRQELNNIQNQLEFNALENEKALTKANETGDYNYSKEPEFAKRWQESEQLKARRDELYNLVREMEKKVPEGPYKDDWHDLALKRVMTYAAKNGYHRVAFSSSKPQVGRWGTESIAFEKIPVGSDSEKSQWLVSATGQRGGVAGHVDLEGEARARGILDQVPQKVVQTRDELRDIIRKIGSRWTDNKVDRVTNKTWKKMQTEKIGVVEPRREGMEEFYDRTFANSQKNFAKKYKGVFGTTEVFDGAPVQGSKRHPANVIDITPEMLKSLDAGIPMKEGGYVDTDRLMRMVDDHFDEHSYADGGEVTSDQPSDDLMSLVDEHFLNQPIEFRKGGRTKYSLDANEPNRMGIAPYGLRYALSASEVPEAKGKGYMGEISGSEDTITEYSLDDRDLGAYPSVTPNQPNENLDEIKRGKVSHSTYQLARKYAAMRKNAGKSAFAQMDELRYPKPQD